MWRPTGRLELASGGEGRFPGFDDEKEVKHVSCGNEEVKGQFQSRDVVVDPA